jgi:UDP-sugar transporter A1/2/3
VITIIVSFYGEYLEVKMGKETNSIVSHHNYPFKWWILVTYVVQNSALLITLRSATLFSNPSSDSVISSTAVLFSEVLKLIFSLIMCFLFDARLSFSNLKNLLLSVINEDSSDLVKLSMPSILYVIQNNLQYIIETRVLYLIMYQFKIITTAMFYSNMLSRRIHFREWSAIIALMIGVSIVEACQNDVEGHYHASYPFGIASVLLAIVTSGFAGVYFEKILKSSKFSM